MYVFRNALLYPRKHFGYRQIQYLTFLGVQYLQSMYVLTYASAYNLGYSIFNAKLWYGVQYSIIIIDTHASYHFKFHNHSPQSHYKQITLHFSVTNIAFLYVYLVYFLAPRIANVSDVVLVSVSLDWSKLSNHVLGVYRLWPLNRYNTGYIGTTR